jgi:threonine dehydrogenase-like Zn-dependent dehydrogenase
VRASEWRPDISAAASSVEIASLEGRIEPGLVFDRITNIDGVPDGYRAMNEREAIKVMIEF